MATERTSLSRPLHTPLTLRSEAKSGAASFDAADPEAWRGGGSEAHEAAIQSYRGFNALRAAADGTLVVAGSAESKEAAQPFLSLFGRSESGTSGSATDGTLRDVASSAKSAVANLRDSAGLTADSTTGRLSAGWSRLQERAGLKEP